MGVSWHETGNAQRANMTGIRHMHDCLGHGYHGQQAQSSAGTCIRTVPCLQLVKMATLTILCCIAAGPQGPSGAGEFACRHWMRARRARKEGLQEKNQIELESNSQLLDHQSHLQVQR